MLLSEEGYDQLSLRKIARRVGIHLKTLQHYFPTKENLIQSTLEHTYTIYTEATEKLSSRTTNAAELFKKYIRYLIKDDKNRQTAGFFLQLWARAHVDEATNNTMMSMYDNHTDNLLRLMEPLNPQMDHKMRRQRAVMIAALIEGMMLFIGYGKKRHRGIGNIETELVKLCFRLATDIESTKPLESN